MTDDAMSDETSSSPVKQTQLQRISRLEQDFLDFTTRMEERSD